MGGGGGEEASGGWRKLSNDEIIALNKINLLSGKWNQEL
jgi:hypothetical protein